MLEAKCEELVPLKCFPMEPKQKLSLEDHPVLELKPLHEHLEYAFVGKNETILVINAKSWNYVEKGRLMEVLS